MVQKSPELGLKRVTHTTTKANDEIKGEKCKFGRDKVPFLGYILSDKGIENDPSKIEAILDYPRSENVKDQSFLGKINFHRRSIPDAATHLTSPQNHKGRKLNKPKPKFLWTDLCEKAFLKLKELLIFAPILNTPDYTEPFIVTIPPLMGMAEHTNLHLCFFVSEIRTKVMPNLCKLNHFKTGFGSQPRSQGHFQMNIQFSDWR